MREPLKYPVNVFVAIVAFFFLVLPITVYTWIVKLEKTGCECSKDWRRNFIHFYVIFNMILVVSSIILLFFKGVVIMDVVPLLGFASAALALTFVIVTVQYVQRLKREKCACSEDTRRNVMYIWALVQGFISLIALLSMAVMIASMVIAFRKRATV